VPEQRGLVSCGDRFLMKLTWATAGLAAAASAVSYAVWTGVPDPMPIHWSASGRADGYASRSLTLMILPALMALIAALIQVPSKVDANYRRGLDVLMIVVAALLFAVHLLVVLTALEAGHKIPMAWLLVLLGVFFIVIGMVLPTMPQNYVFGVRTPWTLTNETNWKLTHRFSAWTMIGGGSICALISVAVPGECALWIGVGAILMGSLLPVGYSYLLHATQLDSTLVEAQEPAVDLKKLS